ncbi:MAG TPA: alpha-1,2-fucosyltransferase [Candidatus Paceibacterota bacterium]|nr:alpha-1,2-fucosyltransferase [Candidatus Paceibacterota bacterium]
MIIVKIHGGLGNQLFQYALGKAVADRNNMPLMLDISGYGRVADRSYGLSPFSVSAAIASPGDIATLLPPADGSFLSRVRRKAFYGVQQLLPIEKRAYVREPHFHFAPEILRAGKNAYLDGYWQSQKYFADIGPEIRKQFALAAPFGPAAAAIASDIAKDARLGRAVSVHVRRGDYVTNPNVTAMNGVCPPEYYRAAAHAMANRLGQPPVYYVFSDDIEWVREHMPFLSPAVFVSRPGIAPHEDIALMSRCSAHILANSTFSWWGAWLDPNPAKIVIAPKEWFRDRSVNTKDVLPPEWIQL